MSRSSAVRILLHQGFQFEAKEHALKSNFTYAHIYYEQLTKTFKFTKQDIIDRVSENNASMYWKIRKFSEIATGPRIDTQTFYQWLDMISE